MSLEQWLDARNMTQVELARTLEVHESVISRAITGRRPASADLRWSFAKVFGFDVAQEVFSETPVEPVPQVAVA